MKTDYLSISNIFSALLWLIILVAIVNYKKNRVENQGIKGYYVYNFWFKILMSLAFSFVYIFIYGGGDTTAYWDGGVVLNNLMFENFGNYIESMVSAPSDELYSFHYNSETGYPPAWIYQEEEAWFVCKIVSIISLITFKSYIAGTFIFAFFIATSTFSLLEKVVQLKIHSYRIAAYCILFIPSVAFWCSGVSKDTVTFWAVLQLIGIFLHRVVFKQKLTYIQIILVLLAIFLLYNIRLFILAATITPLAMAYGSRWTMKYEKSPFTKFLLRFLLISFSSFLFFLFLSSGFAEDLVKEAKLVQDDFTNNAIYTGKRYNLDNTDPSPTGLLSAMPQSVLIGIYKPLPNESLSPNLLFNGIESLILILLTMVFIIRGPLQKMKLIINTEFLVFCLLFTIFIGFMAGFSSVLFGVLVRIRAPLLPFFFLLLTASFKNEKVSIE